MPKFYSSVFILYILEKNGFFFVSQKGSHIKYRKDGEPMLTVIVPANRKQIPAGTFNSILKQSRLLKSDFEKE